MNPLHKPPLDQIAVRRIDLHPNRPTILFLHDSLGCIELWRDFPQQLAEQCQCNAWIYDRQGYGQSCPFSYQERSNDYMEWEADVLSELMDHWQLDKAILFGHSDGGSIALIAASKYPQKIEGVIAEGAHIFVEDITIAGIQDAIKVYQGTPLPAKLARYHGDKTQDMFWAWADTWTRDSFRDWDISSFLAGVQCPSLIIQGEADEYGSLQQVEGIVRGVKGPVEKFIIPKVKHTPHKEVPQEILDRASQFIHQQIAKNAC